MGLEPENRALLVVFVAVCLIIVVPLLVIGACMTGLFGPGR